MRSVDVMTPSGDSDPAGLPEQLSEGTGAAKRDRKLVQSGPCEQSCNGRASLAARRPNRRCTPLDRPSALLPPPFLPPFHLNFQPCPSPPTRSTQRFPRSRWRTFTLRTRSRTRRRRRPCSTTSRSSSPAALAASSLVRMVPVSLFLYCLVARPRWTRCSEQWAELGPDWREKGAQKRHWCGREGGPANTGARSA